MVEFLLTLGLLTVRCLALILTLRPLRSWLGSAECGALAFVVAVALTPSALELGPAGLVPRFATASTVELLALACREAILGICLGVPFSISLECLPLLGRLIDSLRGAQFAEQLLPGLEERSSYLETLGVLVGLLLLGPFGGLRWIYTCLLQSLFLPTWHLGLPIYPGGSASVAAIAIRHSSAVLELAVSLTSPLFVVVLGVDLLTVFLSRCVPRLQVVAEALTLKMLLGIAVSGLIASSAGEIVRQLVTLTRQGTNGLLQATGG